MFVLPTLVASPSSPAGGPARRKPLAVEPDAAASRDAGNLALKLIQRGFQGFSGAECFILYRNKKSHPGSFGHETK